MVNRNVTAGLFNKALISPFGRFHLVLMSLRTVFAFFLIVSFTVGGCERAQNEQPIRLADKLAAHPEDPTKPAAVAGVPDDKFQSAEAIEAAVKACVDAIKADPNEPRYQFELGRILFLGGMMDEAREHLEAAAQQGYAGAYFYLGGMELDTAKGFFQKASAAKFKPADKLVGDLKSIDAFQPRKWNWHWWLIGAGLVVVVVAVLLVVRRRRSSKQAIAQHAEPPQTA